MQEKKYGYTGYLKDLLKEHQQDLQQNILKFNIYALRLRSITAPKIVTPAEAGAEK